MKQLNADIKNKDFKKIYLFFGEEGFLKHSYKNSFRSAVVGDNQINCSYFEGKDISVDAVIDSAYTAPFFADKKLVIVENSDWFKNSNDKINEYIDKFPDTTCILFVEDNVDKRSKLYKKVSSIGYACEMSLQEEGELSKWAARILSAAGKKITQADMQMLLSYTGLDMYRVKGELEKLIAYVGEREVISRNDIKEITTVTEQNRIFDMVRAISEKKPSQALKLYSDLLALKEPPMRIMYLIARQFNQLLQVKEMIADGSDKMSIASVLKIPAGVAEKIMRQVRVQDRETLLGYVNECVELEEAVKTGDIPDRLAVELLICR